MADGTIGWTAENGSGSHKFNRTYIGIYADAKATCTGTLYKIDAYATANTTTIIKVFRDDDTNYLYIGGESFSLSAGLNSDQEFVTPLEVEEGDILGMYDNSGGIDNEALSGGNAGKSGNITEDSLKSGWAGYDYDFKVMGYIEPLKKGGFFIFLAEAFEKHNKLWRPKLAIPKLGYQI